MPILGTCHAIDNGRVQASHAAELATKLAAHGWQANASTYPLLGRGLSSDLWCECALFEFIILLHVAGCLHFFLSVPLVGAETLNKLLSFLRSGMTHEDHQQNITNPACASLHACMTCYSLTLKQAPYLGSALQQCMLQIQDKVSSHPRFSAIRTSSTGCQPCTEPLQLPPTSPEMLSLTAAGAFCTTPALDRSGTNVHASLRSVNTASCIAARRCLPRWFSDNSSRGVACE